MASARSSGLASIFRFTAQTNPTSRCSKCLRAQRCPFSSARACRSNSGSKRPLMTESAYRPQTLDSAMPALATRNVTPLETSISSSLQQPQQTSWPSKAPWQGETSLREGEAQKSKFPPPPVETVSTAPSQTPSTQPAPRKSKLRPRKAAMNLSPTAVEHLRQLQDQPDGKYIRVGVKNRGCSGLAYHLEYVDKPGAFDEAVEQDGVKVLIDSKALFSIIGSEMDWLEDKLAARFVFKNPNITEQCGCGESFSIS